MSRSRTQIVVHSVVLSSSLLLAGCGASTTTAEAAPESTSPAPATVDVPVVTATVGTVASALEISGMLAPRSRVAVKPKLPGMIERVLVDIGDAVTMGQTIATIDRREIDAQADASIAAVAVAKAALETAEASLANAVLEYERAKNLFEKGALPRQRLEGAQTAHRSAVAQRDLAAANLAQSEAALRRAREVLRNATITSPVTGHVVEPIYTGGRLNNAYGITTASLDGSKLELARTRQEIEYRVVETFYAALMNQRGVTVADQQVRLTQKQLELARVRFESGTVARLDVLQAEVELANSKARRIQAKAQVDIALQALRSVLAVPQSQPLDLQGSLDEPVVGHARTQLDEELPKRPDLQAFAARRHAAEYASNLAHSEWKPNLSFTGNMQYQQDSWSSLFGRDNQSYTFGLSLNVPLFAAPGAAARRGIAQSQMRQAEHGLRHATDHARLELESAWTALESSAEVVATQEKALELARESVAIAQVSYENGVITSAELNDAQVRLLQTEWLLMQAKYARITAAARAKVAAGISS